MEAAGALVLIIDDDDSLDTARKTIREIGRQAAATAHWDYGAQYKKAA